MSSVRCRWLPLALALCATLAHASDMTLERAIDLALTQNRDLQRAQTLLDDSAADMEAASSQFDFHVQPLLSVQRIGNEQLKNYGLAVSKEFEMGTTLNASATRGDTVLPDGVVMVQPAVSVSITQPLFRNLGAARNTAHERDAESMAVTARRRYEEMRQQLVTTVVDRYTELFRLQQQIKVDELDVQHSTELVRLTSAYELVGRSKHLDTLRAAFQRVHAEGLLSADGQRLVSAQADFADLLGFPTTSVFIAQATGWADFSGLDLDAATQTALQNRLDYAQALQDYADASRDLAAADNGLLPDIGMTVGYQRFNQTPLPGSSVPAGGGVFLGLSGNSVLQDPEAKAAARKGRTDREAARQNVGIVEAAISRDVEQGVSGYQQARTENDIAAHASAGADARLRLARELFHMGRTDSFAVADAEQAYVQSQAALLNANAEVTRASYRLSLALGTLLAPPDDLKPPSRGSR
jgi:outer membrane protein TolC